MAKSVNITKHLYSTQATFMTDILLLAKPLLQSNIGICKSYDNAIQEHCALRSTPFLAYGSTNSNDVLYTYLIWFW